MKPINREHILGNLGRVAVLMGGSSSEREISLLSGNAVVDGLKRLGVETAVIDVGDDVISRLQSEQPDLVFNMLHGKGGEDGVIQGMLEMMNLPYTGSGVLASALAMDKVKSKQIWLQQGLPTAEFEVLSEHTDWAAVVSQFGEVVVKPVSGGSSLGISMVQTAEALQQEFKNAQEFDQHVMAERRIVGNEYSTGVLGEQLLPTILLETKRDFFDFEAKYVDEATQITCPLNLPEDVQQRIDEMVLAAYRSLNCKGLARVDFMEDSKGDFYLLELNTIPGMTSHSFVPTSAARVGIDFDELLLRILDEEIAH